MEIISQSELKELLSYDKDSGVFTWLKKPSRKIVIGDIAGCVKGEGYSSIKINGRLYLAHRLAWLYVHGKFPKEVIDHINGDRADNRISNLREATQSENQQNRSPSGVSCRKNSNKWRAYIAVAGKQFHLGYFDTEDAAKTAYLSAKAEMHPFSKEARL